MSVNVATVNITTDASGDAEVITSVLNGRILQVRYDPDDTSPLDTGADLDIVGNQTGIVIANHDNIGTSAFTRAYRQPIHGADGVASLYAPSTGEPVEDYVFVAEALKVTIAQGGASKSGTFYIWFG